MLPYYGKNIESADVGGRIVSVECEKCGCEYGYELTRIGTGKGTAHYGLGIENATHVAQNQAQRDLRHRLFLEAELVPCPKCNWINRELVQGYRLGQYRNVKTLALAVGFFGTIASLISAWFISIGPAADRNALPYCLFGGPALFVSLAVGLILLQNWMRSRIQPNRNFPLAPTLPPGTPPPMLVNESTGELKLAATNNQQDIYIRGQLDFQFGRHELPDRCCDCMQVAAVKHSYKLFVSNTMDLDIPRCAPCDRLSKRKYWRVWWFTVVTGTLICVGILVLLNLQLAELWIFSCVSLAISIAVASFIALKVTAPVTMIYTDESRGVVRLQFRNVEYEKLVTQKLTKS